MVEPQTVFGCVLLILAYNTIAQLTIVLIPTCRSIWCIIIRCTHYSIYTLRARSHISPLGNENEPLNCYLYNVIALSLLELLSNDKLYLVTL